MVVGVAVIALAWTVGEYYAWGPNAAENSSALASSIQAGVGQVCSGVNVKFAKKKDIQQADAIADRYGLTHENGLRDVFHDEMDARKAKGQKLSWAEMEAIAREIAEQAGLK